MNVLVTSPPSKSSARPSELRDFLNLLERDHPKELLRISEEVNPANFEVTAILANLEQKGINPMVLFERPVNQLGKV